MVSPQESRERAQEQSGLMSERRDITVAIQEDIKTHRTWMGLDTPILRRFDDTPNRTSGAGRASSDPKRRTFGLDKYLLIQQLLGI